MGLRNLDTDSVLHILSYLLVSEAMALGASCRRYHSFLETSLYWELAFERQFGEISVRGAADKQEVMRGLVLDLLRLVREQSLSSLLASVTSASGCDREEENPSNVLRPSPCYRAFHLFLSQGIYEGGQWDTVVAAQLQQQKCRCGSGLSRACYWSSRPSPRSDVKEFISFNLLCDVALVAGLSLTPYRAFFQRNAPVYAPASVLVQFRHGSDGPIYFTSEEFSVRNVFEEQCFVFAEPALFLGGEVRVLFINMLQRQTIPGQEHFYICISHLALVGYILRGFDSPPAGHYNGNQNAIRRTNIERFNRTRSSHMLSRDETEVRYEDWEVSSAYLAADSPFWNCSLSRL